MQVESAVKVDDVGTQQSQGMYNILKINKLIHLQWH